MTIQTNDTSQPVRDLVVVGAGPAGMSAAIEACRSGLSVTVLDEQPEPGGQIFRGATAPRLTDQSILGSEYLAGTELISEFLECTLDYQPGASVWSVDENRHVAYSRNGKSTIVRAKALILATGAIERPMPIPGWTLPGVMALGSAQILLKTSAVVPNSPYVIAGAGPLLLLTAVQLCRAGAFPEAILETTTQSVSGEFARDPLAAIAGASLIRKGLRWLRELRNYGVLRISGVRGLTAHGESHLTHVTYDSDMGTGRIDARTLFLHHGVIPHVNLACAAGCQLDWLDSKRYWAPRTDYDGAASIPDVFIVGDSAKILGVEGAIASGRLAGLRVAEQQNGKTQSQNSVAEQKRACKTLAEQSRFRRALDTAYMTDEMYHAPSGDDTIVCRCEEVTAGHLRAIACPTLMQANQIKSQTRVGMGPCQGRSCSVTVTQTLGDASGQSPTEIGHFNLRPPVKPVAVSEFAGLHRDLNG